MLVSFPGSIPSRSEQHGGSVFRKSSVWSFLPLILQAASCNCPIFTNGCTSPPGEVSSRSDGGNNIGVSHSLVSNCGYHACVCHVGVINTISPWSLASLARHLLIRQNGGKAYIILPRHSHEKASIIRALRSGFQLTYVGSCVVKRSANRSMCSWPHCWFSILNSCGSSFQQLLSCR